MFVLIKCFNVRIFSLCFIHVNFVLCAAILARAHVYLIVILLVKER